MENVIYGIKNCDTMKKTFAWFAGASVGHRFHDYKKSGIDAATPMVGRDLADASLHLPGRALTQYDRNFAFMQGEEVVVLQPGRPPAQYRHERDGGRLMPMALSPALAHEAHAQALWGSLAYDRGWYRLPAPASVSAPAGR